MKYNDTLKGVFFILGRSVDALSATFWNIRRRKRAAELAKQQAAVEAAAPYKLEPAVEEVKAPKKKAVKKDGK